jgi:DNA replication protein DnaC
MVVTGKTHLAIAMARACIRFGRPVRQHRKISASHPASKQRRTSAALDTPAPITRP